MFDFKLAEYARLYNMLADANLDPISVLELIEELIPDVREIEQRDQFQFHEMVVDDTTLKMVHDMRVAARELLPHMESLVGEFNGVSNTEVALFLRNLPPLLVSISLILYKTYGFDTVVEKIDGSGGLDISAGVYSKYVIEMAAESIQKVHENASIICSVLSKFQPYLPEYILSEEDISDLQDAIMKEGMPSNAIATLTPEFVDKVLKGNYLGA